MKELNILISALVAAFALVNCTTNPNTDDVKKRDVDQIVQKSPAKVLIQDEITLNGFDRLGGGAVSDSVFIHLTQKGQYYVVCLNALQSHDSGGSPNFQILDTLGVNSSEAIINLQECQDSNGQTVFLAKGDASRSIKLAISIDEGMEDLVAENAQGEFLCESDGPDEDEFDDY